MTELTRAQRLALALDRNLSVTAGAGTGKTRVLVARFLAVLAAARHRDALGATAGARPRDIVAVTFTRKAANEMRAKVLRAVSEQVDSARRSAEADGYRFWSAMRRELDDAFITTIHGLAARIVRESALDLGVDPRFRILEGIDEERLMREAIARALESPPAAARSGLVAVLATRSGGELRGLLQTLIRDRDRAGKWARRLVVEGDDAVMAALWEAVPVDPEESEARIEAAAALFAPLPETAELSGVSASAQRVVAGLLAAGAACRRARGAGHRERVAALHRLLVHATTQAGDLYARASGAVGSKQAWKALGRPEGQQEVFEALNAVIAPLVGRLAHLPGDADRRLIRAMRAVATVYLDAGARYAELKRTLGAHDYGDLEHLAVRALSLPGVPETYRRRFRYVLVDEFQDTNPTQWDLIRALAVPPLALEPAAPGETAGVEAAGGWASALELEAAAPARRATSGEPPQGDALAAMGIERLDPETGPEGEVAAAVAEPTAQLGEDRLFIVGDAKQSIYAFRGADVGVYQHSRRAVRGANESSGVVHEDPMVAGDSGRLEPCADATEAERGGEVTLDVNFRSLSALVGFTNRFFDALFAPEEPGGASVHEAEPGPLRAHRQGLADGTKGSVRFLVTPSHLDGAVALGHLSVEEAAATDAVRHAYRRLALDIAVRVQGPVEQRLNVADGKKRDAQGREATRPAKFGDVAVLLPRKTHLRELEEALTLHGVPYVVVKGRGFWARQEVWDVVNLLSVLAAPRRDAALFAVLRSAFFAWPDAAFACLPRDAGYTLYDRIAAVARGDATWRPPPGFAGVPPAQVHASIKRWAERSRGSSTARVVEEILAETAYAAALALDPRAHQAVRNLERLVTRIREFEQEDGVHLYALARRLEALAEAGQDEGEAVLPAAEENAVRVMTVHAAKGLEFPIVYVAELEAAFQHGVGGGMLGVSVGDVAGAPFYALKVRGPDGEPEDGFALRLVKGQQVTRDRAEMKRVFYVAVTRAQDHLVLCARSDRLAGNRTGKVPALKPIAQTRSWLDWVESVLALDESFYSALRARDEKQVEVALGGEASLVVDARASSAQTAPAEAGGDAPDPAPLVVHAAPPAVLPVVALTASGVEVAPRCHAWFRYRALEGLPELRVAAATGRAPEYGARFGTWLHRALASGATRERPVPESLARRVADEVETWQAEGWPPVARVLEDLSRHVERALVASGSHEVVLLEHAVDAVVAPGVRVVGRLDRVHRDEAGRLFVVDLKTDRVAPGQEEAHMRSHGYDAQVALYDAALRLGGIETAPPRLLFSATGAWVKVEERPGVLLEDLFARIALMHERLAPDVVGEERTAVLEEVWPKTARDAAICGSCPFHARIGGPCTGV